MVAVRTTLFALLALLSIPAGAAPLTPEQVPEPLKPWISWALRGHENLACPFPFDAPEQRHCQWPTRLALDLTERGGRFEFVVRSYADGWSTLPGDTQHWPQDVRLDGKPAIVTPEGETPRIWLPKGSHSIDGAFVWDRLPENLTVPRDAGLLSLRISGRDLPFPVFNEQGQLWVQTDAAARAGRLEIENRMDLEVFRRIVDEIPLQMLTRLSLNVAGLPREILLKGALLQDFVPLSVSSELPARVEPDGTLRLQLRPGAWEIDVTSRHPGALEKLALPALPEPWPVQEVWAFDARTPLRMVQIEGVPAIDPRQTNLPDDWKALPAYQLNAGDTFSLQVLRRGDPEPEPDSLSLTRRLWLDFDGGGFTANDAIGGKMTRAWRLEASDPLKLGRVSIDGQPQSITRLQDPGPVGVEVRRGAINLSADSRFVGSAGHLPAAGWNTDFHQVRTQLNLPPGWRLVAALGVDDAPETWIGRWTLLDLFVVLIVSLAAARLWNYPTAAVALVVLSLLWHEPGAPRYVWLNLLIAIALLRVLPAGRFARGITIFRNLCLAALALIAIPFAYDQVRFGLYPQLEMPWLGAGLLTAQSTIDGAVSDLAEAPVPAAAPPMNSEGSEGRGESAALNAPTEYLSRAAKRYGGAAPEVRQAAKYSEIDPNAITQTGPGLPKWRWREVSLSWNGPVVSGQDIHLLLLSPAANLFLNLARVVLLAVLAALFLGYRNKADSKPPPLLMLLPLLWLPTLDARADFPDAPMLQQLSERLLEAPECLPACAEIPRLQIKASPGELQQTLEIHASQRVIVPLPAQEDQWLPNRGTLDGAPLESLMRVDGGLWLSLEPGHHVVVLSGPLPQREQVQLPLPLKPRRVDLEATGWQVEGVEENGVPDTQLRLLRLAGGPGEPSSHLEPRPLEPFLTVERTLQIGLDWRVGTTVSRLSPPDLPISLEIPLLDGEAVTTPGLTAKNGRLSVNLPPGETALHWDSVLEKRPQIKLRAPETTLWAETWKVDVSPVWHLTSDGIPVIHHQDTGGAWLPEWRPWPGEEVALNFVRPAGAPGSTLTIDDTSLELSPGLRATDATLKLTIRSAQGAQHALKLPEGAVLQNIALDGSSQPIRQQDRQVTIPLHPGSQTISLQWRSESGIGTLFRTPPVDVGAPSVDAGLRVSLGQDRWVLLLGGPSWGPAVLFWGMLVVITGLALLLGRIDRTPLKTRSWLLLLIGLSQIHIAAGLLVVVWLLALGQRARLEPGLDDNRFNAIQVGLGVLTALALLFLLHAVEQGLLGVPDMQVAGGGSTAYALHWYQDRSGPELPRAWIVSVPLWLYRVAMLAWALWLALSLLGWLRWGWACFAEGGLWRRRPPGAAPSEPSKENPWTDSPPAPK